MSQTQPQINVDLFGWDTSFGISFDDVNASIVAQKSTPPNFSQGTQSSSAAISGTWSDWSFTLNGDGKNINLKCPIQSGTYTSLTGQQIDLGSQGANWIEIELRLEAFDSSGEWYDNTSTKDSGQMKEHKVKSSGGTPESPIVSIYAISLTASQPPLNQLPDPELQQDVCQGLFSTYFKNNLGEFNNIFSKFLLNAQADKGNFQWLKPTTTDYAVETTDQMSTSIFSVLCMTENRTAPTSGNATDPRLLSAAGSSAVFAIAQKRFLENWLMPGIALANAGTSLDNYFMYSDTLITNNKDLTFKNRVQNSSNNPVDLKVPQGNFKMGIFDTQVVVRFDGASFEYGDGITCELNYVDYYNLSLLPGDGHNALHVTPVNKLPDLQMAMQVAEWRQKRDLWIEIGVSVGVSVLGAILAPTLGPLLGKAFGAIADTAVAKAIAEGLNAAVVSITEVIEQAAATEVGQVITAAIDTATATLSELVEQIGALNAGEKTIGELASEIAAYVSGKATSVGQFFMSNRYLIIGGMIGGATGVILGDIPTIIITNEKAEIPNMASLNEFADNAVGTIQWPSGVFQLSSAQLAGVLLLGGTLQ